MKKNNFGAKAVLFAALAVIAGALFACKTTAVPRDTRPIVCFGDSLTNGNNLDIGAPTDRPAIRDQAYPALLAAKVTVPVINISRSGMAVVPNTYETYFPDPFDVVNAADVSGADPALAASLVGKTFVEAVVACNPQAVIISLGANDFGFAGGYATVEPYVNTVFKPAYQAIIDSLKVIPDIKIFIGDGYPSAGTDISNQRLLAKRYPTSPVKLFAPKTVADLTDSELDAELFAAYVPWQRVLKTTLAAENPTVDITYIGCIYDGAWGDNTGFAETPVKYAAKPQYPTMSDLYHPNTAGYVIEAENVYNAIEPYLKAKRIIN
jgi:lysophospholipase L1-like esterase